MPGGHKYRCYLTLTQALHLRMGGNPFGPAGTGKTESVKALGAQLGRFVLVFNCDESFDYSAMGRLFAGLCQVGCLFLFSCGRASRLARCFCLVVLWRYLLWNKHTGAFSLVLSVCC